VVTGHNPHATILWSEPAFWIRAEAYHAIWLNGAYVAGKIDHPLYDGDVIELAQTRFVLRIVR
jgi:hypothetical protein